MSDPTTPTETALAIVVPESERLSPSLLSNIEAGFAESFKQAEAWRSKALAIQITSITGNSFNTTRLMEKNGSRQNQSSPESKLATSTPTP